MVNESSPTRAEVTAMDDETVTGLSEGRIVHYVAYNGRHLAAIITGIVAISGTVNLVVFTDMRNVNGGQSGGVQFHFEVPHSKQAEPGYWHWPERV